jgi:copper transport protein
MPVGTAVLVDGHESGKASSGPCAQTPARRARLAATAAALAALVVPATAAAHATLVATHPANGAVLLRPPAEVRVDFDDTVRVGSGIAAVANETNRSVLAGRAVAHGRVLEIPLRPRLPNGAYSIRWSIVSDDGHLERGVIAFAVGRGAAVPRAVLGASTPLSWSDIVLRSLYYLGILAGAGAAAFAVVNRRILGDGLRAPAAHLVFFSLLAVFLGASGIVHTEPPGTRYALVVKIALTVALAAGAAAALAPSLPRLFLPSLAGALALVAEPTLSGHALDRGQPRVITPLVDLAHIAAAAVWLGGLCSLVYVLPRATPDAETRQAVVRRFSTTALVSVLVLAASGLGRALTELSGVSQVWSTSYGRALVVKTALFVPLLALGYVNRTFLLRSLARLRRSALAELTLLTGIAVAVAVLTQLRPGSVASVLRVTGGPPAAAALPPRDAVVQAHEVGTLAVAVARTPGRVTVTLLDSNGSALDGEDVRVNDVRTVTCGSGCYSAPATTATLHLRVGSQSTVFTAPAHAPSATPLLRDVTRRYRAARTIVFDERLASSPTDAIQTRFTIVAPHRLSYVTRNGPQGIVIGARRWDRDGPRASWVESPQAPVGVTAPYWSNPTNVHEIAPGVITFLDRAVPAWFTLQLEGTRPRVLRMTAAAHFMVDRYVGFDVPATVSPPSR